MNWPNRLTIFRMLLVPVFVLAILYHRLDIGFVIFVIATLTDALDGYLARVLNQKTRLGSLMDPIADKLLLGSAFFCFSLIKGLPAYIKMPIYVPLVVISRDILLVLGVFVVNFMKGEVNIKPTALGKITTVLQMLTIIAVLVRFTYSSWVWNLMVVLTIISGFDYIVTGARGINERE